MTCSIKFTFPPSISDRWLDSSKTLYEQDVKEHDLLFLRFKYYSFMDVDPRVGGELGVDIVRVGIGGEGGRI